MAIPIENALQIAGGSFIARSFLFIAQISISYDGTL